MVSALPERKPSAPAMHRRPDVAPKLVLAGGIGLTLLVAFLVYFFWPWARVPDMIGRPEAEAMAAASRAGLKWQRQEQASETASPGTVIAASPAAGEIVEKGIVLTLVIALPVRVTVPAVVGRTAAEAAGELDRLGVKWQRQEEPSDTAAAGTVIGMSPSPGQTVDRGSAVVLRVATLMTVSVPPLIGKTEAEATAALSRAGLEWRRRTEPADNAASGTVIGISPPAKVMVDKGSKVTLTIAVPVKIAVPPIVGKSEADAATALERLGLKGQRQEQQSDAAVAGTVTATSPLVGQFVEKGAAVTLIVAVPAGIAVPPVGGQPVAEAVAALARAGFKWQREDQPSDAVAAGRVVSSSPAAGQMIDKGSTVTLVVAVPVRVGVPRVIGQPLTKALTALSRAGLKAQRQEETSDRMGAGKVISIAPPAGQLVDKGTTVVLVVAKAPARPKPPPATERPAAETASARRETPAAPVQQPEPAPAPVGTGAARPWAPGPPQWPNSAGNYGGWPQPQPRLQVGPVTLWPPNPAPSPAPGGAGSYGWQAPRDPVGDSYDRAHQQPGGAR